MTSKSGAVGSAAAPLRHALRGQALAEAQFLAALARQLGLTYRQALALEHLAHRGQLTARDLAGRLHVSPSGSSALLRRLEAAGHVSRCGDRRSAPVRATSRAMSLLAAGRAPLASAIDDLSAGLAPEHRDEITRLLQAAAEVAEHAAGRLAADAGRRARDALAAPEPPLWG